MESWEANNSKIITWINNYVSQSIGVHMQNMKQQKRFGITWIGCMCCPTLQNNISWRLICGLFNKTWAYSRILFCHVQPFGTSWLLLNMLNYNHSNHILIKEKSNVWSNFLWLSRITLKGFADRYCIVIAFQVLIMWLMNCLLERLDFDECSFCKQKSHFKSHCPKLLN